MNLRGSTAEVIVRPRTRIEEEPGTGGQPANVVSLYDGVVRSIEVYSGTPQVKVGDTVCAGDLLIGAIVETTNGRSSVKQASGRVMIEHEEDLAVAVPLTEQMLLPTGEVRQVRSLEFCGLEIPLGPDPVGETRTETREHRLTAFGTPLPVVLIVREHSLLEEQEVTRFITAIPDEQLRVIFRLRFLRGLTWGEVAAVVGGRNTEEAVKSSAYRYLNS